MVTQGQALLFAGRCFLSLTSFLSKDRHLLVTVPLVSPSFWLYSQPVLIILCHELGQAPLVTNQFNSYNISCGATKLAFRKVITVHLYSTFYIYPYTKRD
jgi:hypothetical protein